MATGKVPPVAKSGPQNDHDSKDIKRTATPSLLFLSPNRDSDLTAQNSCGAVGICKFDEDSRDQMESSTPFRDTGGSSCIPCHDSADPEGTEFKQCSSHLDLCCHHSALTELENCGVDTEGDTSQVARTPSQSDTQNLWFPAL